MGLRKLIRRMRLENLKWINSQPGARVAHWLPHPDGRLQLKYGSWVVLGSIQSYSSHTTISLTHCRAFAIWAPIFMGELALVTTQLFVGETDSLAPMIKAATVPFVAANVLQSLWCAAFRPKYKGAWMGVSFAALASTAYSLSKVHTATLGLTGWKYLVYGLPISMHFGWVTAASLVNLNGAVAMCRMSSAKTVAWLGHLSVVAATALGVAVTVSRKAPVYGGVICWALMAVADGMKKRVAATKDEKDQTRVGVLGAKLQERLSKVGAYVSGGASLFVTIAAIMASRASISKMAP
jgi:hypothetical protein